MRRPGPTVDPAASTTAAAASAICIGCGLCCDGTLHATAKVRPDDEINVIAVGLEVVEDGQRRFFRQPCPHFSCGACSIYQKRPKVCRNYRCALLMSVESGNISKSAAREKILEARRLVAVVRATDPAAVTPAQRTAFAGRLKAKLSELEGPERQRVAKTLLDTAILEHFLARWFLKDKKKAEEESSHASERGY